MENMEYSRAKTIIAATMVLCMCNIASAGVITKLPTGENIVALTFDACETKTPAYLDDRVLGYLLKEQIPFTLFVSGKFAERNRERLAEISKYDFVEIENHSMMHHQHMEKLSREDVIREVADNERIVHEITGRRPVFFRFPAGNYDAKTLHLVESQGYKVVHWTFPSGDPDKTTSANKLTGWVTSKTKRGSILIFHINGRGYKTGEALPRIVEALRRKGYRFVRVDESVRPN
jgi:peptidoglycan-N-acetylglucosamine deacetylase